MKSILKLTNRSIISFFSRYLALLLIVLLGVGFFSGLKVTKEAMADTLQGFYDRQIFSDFRLYSTLGFSEDDVSEFEKLSDVKDSEGIKTIDAFLDFASKTDAYTVFSMPEKINLPSIVSGRLPEKENECAVDSKCFSESDIGKKISLSENNDDDTESSFNTKEFTITGIADSPLFVGDDRGTASIGNGTPMGFVYVLPSTFSTDYFSEIDIKLKENAPVYSDEYDKMVDDAKNEIEDTLNTVTDKRYENIADKAYDTAKKEAKNKAKKSVNESLQSLPYALLDTEVQALQDEAVKKALNEIPDKESILEGAGIEKPSTYVLTRNENAGYLSFNNDTSILSGIADIFPIFFVLIAMLISITTVSRMVEEERMQIGTLKSLGFSDSLITLKYLLYSGSATLIGDLLGFFLGTYFLPKVFWYAYHTIYDFAPIEYVFSLPLFILTLAVSVSLILISTFLSCRSELIEKPAALIRPKQLKGGKKILLENIKPFWSKLSFLQKITLRNMFRYKRRLIMMLVGISLCTALLVTSFGVRDSMINISSIQYDEIQKYSIEAGFSSFDKDFVLSRIAGLSKDYSFLPCMKERVDLDSKKNNMSAVSLYAFDKKSDFDSYFSLSNEGNAISFPEKGCALICTKIAETLDLSIGDSFEISDADHNTIKIKVCGIFENYVDNFLIVSSDTLSDDTISFKPNTCLIKFYKENNVADADKLAETLTKISEINSVTKLSDSRNKVNNALSCLNYIIVMMVLFSGLLAFVVIFNLTNINLAERSREIATVEVLGFYEKETDDYVLRENIMSSVLASIIGLPIGYIMHNLVMHLIVVKNMVFDIHIKVQSYILSVVFTIIFALVVNLFMRKEIRKIPMAESLKAVE